MWLFLVFCLPLALVHALFAWYPAHDAENLKRVAIRGLISSLPVWYLSRFLGSLMPTFTGSPLFAFHEWFDRILPYSLLPLLAYAFFWHLDERLDGDALQKRMTLFFGACLAPFGFAEMTRELHHADLYVVAILPLYLTAVVALMPALFRAWRDAWTSRRALFATLFVSAGLLLSLTRWLLLARFWYLALPIVAAAVAVTWRLALPGLRQDSSRKVSLA